MPAGARAARTSRSASTARRARLGERSCAPLPASERGEVAGGEQRESQQAVFQAHLQKLQEEGPLEVILGEPRLLFSITNSPNDVLNGFLELVGPNPDATR